MTDLSGLKNFRKRIEQTSNNIKSEKILDELADYGETKALQYWGGYNVYIITEKPSKYYRRIVAQGKEVAFIEYGTGEYAKGTYNGNIPANWQYYYDSPYKRTSKTSGIKGWFTTQITGDKMFVWGMSAVAPMYKTSLDLRSKISELEIVGD